MPMRQRHGFTLLEVVIASGLTVFLAVMLSSVWAGVGRPAASLVNRGQLVQEIEFAVATLSRDLGGSVANPAVRLGDKKLGEWVGWSQPDNNQLRLCFDGGPTPNHEADWAAPDTVIVYRLDSDSLVRWDCNANTVFTVAQNVDSLQVTAEGTDSVRIVLSFTYHDLTRTCTIIAKQP